MSLPAIQVVQRLIVERLKDNADQKQPADPGTDTVIKAPMTFAESRALYDRKFKAVKTCEGALKHVVDQLTQARENISALEISVDAKTLALATANA